MWTIVTADGGRVVTWNGRGDSSFQTETRQVIFLTKNTQIQRGRRHPRLFVCRFVVGLIFCPSLKRKYSKNVSTHDGICLDQ